MIDKNTVRTHFYIVLGKLKKIKKRYSTNTFFYIVLGKLKKLKKIQYEHIFYIVLEKAEKMKKRYPRLNFYEHYDISTQVIRYKKGIKTQKWYAN